MALGGSTNAVVHLIAIAGRLGIDLTLEDFDRISRRTPYLANVKPSGEYLMEDFFHAGGLPALMKEILPLLNRGCLTVTGRTIEENVAEADYNARGYSSLASPIHHEGGIAILGGNLVPERRRGEADGRFTGSTAAPRPKHTFSRTTTRCVLRSIATIWR